METYRPSGFFTMAGFVVLSVIILEIMREYWGNFGILFFLIIALAFDYILFIRLKEYSLSDNELTVTHQLLRTSQTIPYRDIDGIETMYNPPARGRSGLPASYLVRLRHNGAMLTIYFYDAELCNRFITKLAQLSKKEVVKK